MELSDFELGDLLVQQLDPGGAAAKAGLRVGDVIRACGDTPTKTPDDLQAALQKAAGVKDVTLTYWREGADGRAGERTVRCRRGRLAHLCGGDRDAGGRSC